MTPLVITLRDFECGACGECIPEGSEAAYMAWKREADGRIFRALICLECLLAAQRSWSLDMITRNVEFRVAPEILQ